MIFSHGQKSGGSKSNCRSRGKGKGSTLDLLGEGLKEAIFVESFLLSSESSTSLLESVLVLGNLIQAGLVNFKATSVDEDSHRAVSLTLVRAVGSSNNEVPVGHDSFSMLATYNSIVDEQCQGGFITGD